LCRGVWRAGAVEYNCYHHHHDYDYGYRYGYNYYYELDKYLNSVHYYRCHYSYHYSHNNILGKWYRNPNPDPTRHDDQLQQVLQSPGERRMRSHFPS
jgi:hypothetical protein